MAFYIGTDKVIEDTDASAGISTSSNLDKLQINGTDVLTHDGSTITLKNVTFDDASEVSINTDNITQGSTNLFYSTTLFNTDLASKSTSDLAEGTNLYFTNARVNTVLPNTDSLSEGSTNLYFTNARADARIAAADTDDLTEGSTNLYYTDARVNAVLGGGGGTTYASETYVDNAIADLVDTAPATLDTLNELAAALGDDANFSTTITNQIAALTHDGFADFVANEHIDWTSASAGTIHASNYTNTNTTYVSSDFTHDDLTGFVANEHIDWTAASAGTIHASNYSNTGDTTYTAGEGLQLSGTEFSMDGDYAGDFEVDGNFTATGDVTAYSDARLKRNVETISNAVDLVNCLRGVNFEKDGKHSTGVIAQEVEEFLPEVVHTNSEGMKSVAYGNMVGLLIEAIKEQQQTIENLQKKISDIQSSKE